MASTILDGIDYERLTGYIRNLPTRSNFILDQILPNTTVPNIEFTLRRVDKNRKAAPYRPFDTPAPNKGREGFVELTGEIPPISQSKTLREYQRHKIRAAQLGDADDVQIVEDIVYDDAADLVSGVQARIESARAQVLETGKFTPAEYGGSLEADFEVPSEHFVDADTTDSDTWDASGADPIFDLHTWVEVYLDTNGEPPGAFLIDTPTLFKMLRNQSVRELVYAPGASLPNVVTRDNLRQVLTAHGLPQFIVTDTKIDLDDGNGSERAITEGKLIFVPQSLDESFGRTEFGVTAEALELTSMGVIDFQTAPGIVGVVLKQANPVSVQTLVTAVSMPVINNPNLLMVADTTSKS